ncbi:MAG TPA: hypothetical protein VGP24_11790, partial [Glaciihabitans sp.]|nr:hypothetical protein [Glaciihabitans sp.]
RQAPKEPPKESFSINYKDLLPSERAQALQKIGITPGSPDEKPPDEEEPRAAPATIKPAPTAPAGAALATA